MRYLYVVTLLLFLSCAAAQEEEDRYCNETFAFCLDYPKEQLTLQSEADSFAIFTSADEAINLTVTASNNTENWSLEDIYYMKFEDKLRRNPNLEILNEVFNKNNFELIYQEGKLLHFHRVFKHNEIYVELSLYLPNEDKQRFELVKKALNLSFTD